MHEYLMEVTHFFQGVCRFQVIASDKTAAIEKGTEYIKQRYGKDNCYMNTIKVVRKLKPSFGAEG